MKKIIQLGLVAAALTSSAAFAAEGSQWEVWTGDLASVNFQATGASTTTTIAVAGSFKGFNPSIGYIVGNNIEVVLTPSFKSESTGGTTTTTWGALLGVNYSFLSNDMNDAAFVQAQAGAAGTSATGASTMFMWTAAVGKRFPLVPHVNYAPQVSYSSQASSVSGGSATTNFAIVPLQFTLMM